MPPWIANILGLALLIVCPLAFGLTVSWLFRRFRRRRRAESGDG